MASSAFFRVQVTASLAQKGISLGLLTSPNMFYLQNLPQCSVALSSENHLTFFCCWESITSNVLKSHWRMVANFLITEFEFLGFFLCNATLVLLSETKNFLLIFIWRALCCYMRHKSELSPLELSHYNFFTYSMSHAFGLLPFQICLQTHRFQIQGSYCWTYSSGC